MSIFSTISLPKLPSTTFDLSHKRDFALDMGKMVPILVQDVLPGDRFNVKATIILKFSPLLAPIMHNIDCYTHFWFVPNRLCWDKWQDFITGGEDGTLAPSVPYLTGETLNNMGSLLSDYFGIPTDMNNSLHVDAMPFIGYNLIYNEFYRDQNLSDPIDLPTSEEGVVDTYKNELLTLRTRCWRKDYFTSALPFVQRGPQVMASLTGNAPVSGAMVLGRADKGNIIDGDNLTVQAWASDPKNGTLQDDSNHEIVVKSNSDPNALHADLSQAQGITINLLRQLAQVQTWFEANARGGARYVEQIMSHWREVVPDATIQRPQYLGGGKTPVQISEVLQTSSASENGTSIETAAGVGSQYGKAVAVGIDHSFKARFVEHGWIIGIMSVMPEPMYQQGLPRKFSRFDKFDYAWPEFAHLGEQEILVKEIYAGSANPDMVFGYQSRYSEYKYEPNTVHGDFRDSLSFWHLSRIFDNEPKLNQSFVECNPSNRIFAVTSEEYQHLWCELYFNEFVRRKLPRFGTPRLG